MNKLVSRRDLLRLRLRLPASESAVPEAVPAAQPLLNEQTPPGEVIRYDQLTPVDQTKLFGEEKLPFKNEE
jgi:hypothetical protein